jgi:hypothetical protein
MCSNNERLWPSTESISTDTSGAGNFRTGASALKVVSVAPADSRRSMRGSVGASEAEFAMSGPLTPRLRSGTYTAMLGELKDQLSLSREALSTRRRAKANSYQSK